MPEKTVEVLMTFTPIFSSSQTFYSGVRHALSVDLQRTFSPPKYCTGAASAAGQLADSGGYSVVFADRHFGPGHRLARVAARACCRATGSDCRRACRSGFGLFVLAAVFGAGRAGDGTFGLENLRQFGATHCSGGGCVCSPVGAGTQHRHFALADDRAHDGPAARRRWLVALGMDSALLLLALFLPTMGIAVQVPIAAAATVLAVWMIVAGVAVCFKPKQA